MKLVQNTTSIPSDVIERILDELDPDNLSCAVKVKNTWKRRDYHGTFYPYLAGSLISPKGKRYQLGGGKYACKHLVTIYVPVETRDVILYRGSEALLDWPRDGRVFIEVDKREVGFRLVAAHEIEHVRREEFHQAQGELPADAAMIREAKRLGLRIFRCDEEGDENERTPIH